MKTNSQGLKYVIPISYPWRRLCLQEASETLRAYRFAFASSAPDSRKGFGAFSIAFQSRMATRPIGRLG